MLNLFNLYLLGRNHDMLSPWISLMIAAITRNPEGKVDRKEQIVDTKLLLSLLKTGEILPEDLISEFTRKYSSIATERILNYHFGKNFKKRR